MSEIINDGFPCMYLFMRNRTDLPLAKHRFFFIITYLFIMANYSNSENNVPLRNVKIILYRHLICLFGSYCRLYYQTKRLRDYDIFQKIPLIYLLLSIYHYLLLSINYYYIFIIIYLLYIYYIFIYLFISVLFCLFIIIYCNA